MRFSNTMFSTKTNSTCCITNSNIIYFNSNIKKHDIMKYTCNGYLVWQTDRLPSESFFVCDDLSLSSNIAPYITVTYSMTWYSWHLQLYSRVVSYTLFYFLTVVTRKMFKWQHLSIVFKIWYSVLDLNVTYMHELV